MKLNASKCKVMSFNHHRYTSTVKLLINAGSPINAGSLLNAGGYLSNVQINAGSPINAGSLINAGSPINAVFQSLC